MLSVVMISKKYFPPSLPERLFGCRATVVRHRLGNGRPSSMHYCRVQFIVLRRPSRCDSDSGCKLTDSIRFLENVGFADSIPFHLAWKAQLSDSIRCSVGLPSDSIRCVDALLWLKNINFCGVQRKCGSWLRDIFVGHSWPEPCFFLDTPTRCVDLVAMDRCHCLSPFARHSVWLGQCSLAIVSFSSVVSVCHRFPLDLRHVHFDRAVV